MKVTIEEIEAKKTKNGGWTKDTLAEWGIPWPPVKGWKQRLIDQGAAIQSDKTPDKECR